MDNLQVLFFILVLLFVFYEFLKLYKKRKKMENDFNKAFYEFNFDRIAPISKESFKDYYRMNYILDPFSRSYGSYKDSNHRNGDELIENKNRDAKERLISHLHICSKKRSILSLGYNFKNKDNIKPFITLLYECTDKGTKLSFPINNEWFIFERFDNTFGISCKKGLIIPSEISNLL